MSDNSRNRTIARNTLFMYARMLLLLLITLYSSRLILQVLGVENYGIYNVVGGFVVLFSFINGALATGTQRHLSIERGKADGDISRIFSACLNAHVVISGFVFLFAETIGFWFLNTQMNFPDGRLLAANCVYQFSVLTCISNIIQAPFNAAIIAYEKMSFYAYFGILEAVLKLTTVFLLLLYGGDQLILFAGLQFTVSIVLTCGLAVYVLKSIRLSHTRVRDRSLYKYIFSFSGWTLFGSLATLLETQGLNILLNIFGGVAYNAAVGIANQVRGAITQFVAGFQQALNPQLVMSQASNNRERQFDLIFKSSRFSFFILLALAFPLCLKLDFILQLWLTVVPDYTTQICILAIFVQLIECLSSPLYTTIFAIGEIRTYQLMVFLLRLASVILGFFLCKFGVEFYWVFLGPCIIALALFVYRLLYVRNRIYLPIGLFIRQVILPIFIVLALIMIPVIYIDSKLCMNDSFISVFLELFIVGVYELICISIFGITRTERASIINLIIEKIKKL